MKKYKITFNPNSLFFIWITAVILEIICAIMKCLEGKNYVLYIVTAILYAVSSFLCVISFEEK